MFEYRDHRRADKVWLACVALLMLTFCLVVEDTRHLLSIVPYLFTVALIEARIFLVGNHAARPFAHGRLRCPNDVAMQAPEITISRIDADAFFNFSNGRAPSAGR